MSIQSNWDQAKLEQYIRDTIEESAQLEYKSAGALDRSDGKKREITKDISAFANSAGGVLIYGISEFDSPEMRHLPEKIDPIDRTAYSKEWLEQVINNIQPRIEGIVITPVDYSSSGLSGVVYVIEVPKSHTAHQATDARYYKRLNFEVLMMADYEVRDVMWRTQHPILTPQFYFDRFIEHERSPCLSVRISNTGSDSNDQSCADGAPESGNRTSGRTESLLVHRTRIHRAILGTP